MSERLTYTSGALGGALDEEFERRLADMRAAAPAPFIHVIGGQPSAAGELFARRDPSDATGHLSRAHAAGAETVAAAVRAAHSARTQWGRMPYGERCAHMRAVARAIGERHIELASIVSLETGKTRVESIAEVQEAIDLIETYCAVIEAADGFASPLQSLAPGERNLETLRPYGAFGVIAPFNFPVALAVNMFSAALIAGNTVVVKPSEATPSTGTPLGEAVSAGGLPPRASRAPPSDSLARSAAHARVRSCWRTSTTSLSSACARSPRRSPSEIPQIATRRSGRSSTSRRWRASARASRAPAGTGRSPWVGVGSSSKGTSSSRRWCATCPPATP